MWGVKAAHLLLPAQDLNRPLVRALLLVDLFLFEIQL